MASFVRPVLRVLTLILITYLGLLAALYFGQARLIYLAGRAKPEVMAAQAAGLTLEPWTDKTGATIGWRRPNPEAANRIVVFHGNAGWALLREHFVKALQQVDGGRSWEVLLFEYPGYGARPGTPSERTIVAAASEAFTELLAADKRPLFILGESLGSGPGCAIAARYAEQIGGLALLVPYQSLAEAAAHHYPYVPVTLLMRDRFDNEAALKRYGGRVVFGLAEEDEVVTFAGGKKLYDGYAGPKKLIVFPGLRHNDVDYSPGAPWWNEVSAFLLNHSQ